MNIPTPSSPRQYVGMLMQRINMAHKAGVITGAQTIAFHRRLEPFVQVVMHADPALQNVAPPEDIQQALLSIEKDLERWELKRKPTLLC